ncbi:hypothetical protein ACWEBH_12960 [Micrococcus endophyticus]
MDGWIGVIGTLLGAVVGGGVAYTNGSRDRKLEARRERERRIVDVAGELLQLVDERVRYVEGHLDVVGEYPEDTPDGKPHPARRTLAILELYAPAAVIDSAREYVELVDKWGAGYTPEASRDDVRDARGRYVVDLREFVRSDRAV